jgi:uncharacterized protein (DUF1330 family)
MADASETLIERIVSIHGEQGICPTAADWRTILQQPGDRPVDILNLLAFKTDIDGLRAYLAYSSAVTPAFERVGGRMLYFGQVSHIFGTGDYGSWDAAILTRYPSPHALASFWLDEEFIAAHAHRIDGVERSQAVVLSRLRAG